MTTRTHTSRSASWLLIPLVALVALGLFAVKANAAVIVTDPTLDTTNDLMDIGGGTVFATDSNGLTTASGGGPWATNASANLYDNDVETRAYSVFNNLTPPIYVGVHSMSTAVALGGFAITTDDAAFAWWMPHDFTIQGSNDSTNGYGGTWTDIFVFAGGSGDDFQGDGRLLRDKTYRWNAADNTFLSSATFTSFRLLTNVANEDYAEIEFFAVPEPSGLMLLLSGVIGLGLLRRRR